MSSTAGFDVAVVGGGTAGLTAALAAAHEGARVVLIEREGRIGGDCTYYGCVPSKALIEIAGAVRRARDLLAEGVADSALVVRFDVVMERVRAAIAEVAKDERPERFTEAGIVLMSGSASIVSPTALRMGEAEVRAERLVIATGSRAAIPPVPGLESVSYLTNRTVFGLTRLPDRLIVLGGGAIGLELAQAFARLGSRVRVVEMAERLLQRDEPEAGAVVARALADDGVDVLLGSRVERVERVDDDAVIVEVAGRTIVGDALLVAAGRVGSTEGLGLDRIGVRLERGYVVVDDRCRTSVPNVFAAGDVTGGMQLTHVASHEGVVAGRNAAGRRARVDERVVPSVVFVDPEVARVGLTEAEARERHGAVRAVTFPMSRVDRARVSGRTDGFVKIVTARRRLLGWTGGGRVVGAQVVGHAAGELIHEPALAIRTGMFAGRLAQLIHAYPTTSMAVQQAASQLYPLGRALVENDQDAAGTG